MNTENKTVDTHTHMHAGGLFFTYSQKGDQGKNIRMAPIRLAHKGDYAVNELWGIDLLKYAP